MIRSFDLAIESEAINGLINSPYMMLERFKIECMKKSGYTTATLHLKKSEDPIERKRYRKIERYILFNGANQELDEILENPVNRINHKHEFITEQGVIIVVDYEFLP
jgi:hypothetical protein